MTPNPSEKTIIANEDIPVQDFSTLKFLVSAIFADTLNPEVHNELLNYLWTRQGLLNNHQDVANLSQEFFVNKLNTTQQLDSQTLMHLTRLGKHKEETLSNAQAYIPELRLNPNTVFWPDPTHKNSRSLFTEEPWAKKFNFIDRSVPLGSAGSCFAMEIAHNLQSNGYNYVVTENVFSSDKTGNNYSDSTAAWGILFNVPSLAQLVLKAFDEIRMPKILWHYRETNKLWDPFRENVTFDSIEEFEEDYEKHLAACREAFLKCKVFIMTLGLNEVWFLKPSGHAFSRCPWSVSPSLVEKKILTVEQNVQYLQRMLDVWKSHNPDIKLIVTVSPVPFHATFRGHDHHAIVANCHSKSTLRIAAEQFVNSNKDVYYFPSYEKVMYCTPEPWDPDQRHVSRSCVSGVMKLFNSMFLKQDE